MYVLPAAWKIIRVQICGCLGALRNPKLLLVRENVWLGSGESKKIRRQSSAELEIFRRRWDQAVKEDKNWVDPFERLKKRKRPFYKKPVLPQRQPN